MTIVAYDWGLVSSTFGAYKYFDCREFDPQGGCSFRTAGTEAEVLEAAVRHAVSAHGYRGWQELRLVLRAALRDDSGVPSYASVANRYEKVV